MSEIKVAFWNLQNLFDTTASPIAADLEFTPEQGWTPEVFDVKVAHLAQVIRQMHGGNGPDLLGLCEVENKGVVERLLAEIGRPELRVAHVESPDIRGIDCSLVYSSDRFDDPTPEDMQGHLVHFRYPTRDIFQVRLTLRGGGPELNVLVNHWPSRGAGQYETEPYRLSVATRCGQLVDQLLKVDRQAYEQFPDSAEGLAQLNARWNRNVLLMGDFNDDPFCRSLTDYLLAAKDLDKVEEVLKAGSGRMTPAIDSYLGREAVLFNPSWALLGEPDTGSIFYSSGAANTMNLFDQFIVTRGLYFGTSGLKAREGSMRIFRAPEMTSGPKRRPRAFDRRTQKGASDHFPIELAIDVL